MVLLPACVVVFPRALGQIPTSGAQGAHPPQQGTDQVAEPEKPPKRPHAPWLGANAGAYLPSSPRARGAFGASSIGFGFAWGSVLGRKGFSLRPDLNSVLMSRVSRGWTNTAWVVMGGVEARYTFNSSETLKDRRWVTSPFTPYVGVTLDLQYADLTAHGYGVATKALGPSGSLFVGTSLGRNFFAEARYNFMNNVDQFNLSGLSLGVGVRF